MNSLIRKTLIYGAGPIGRWLALRFEQAGLDVTLLARNQTFSELRDRGVVIKDGLTGVVESARVKLVQRLQPTDDYDLVIVAMSRAARLEVCPIVAQNHNVQHILFLGNDVNGFHRYLDHLPAEKVLLGFPTAGGGWDGDDLVFMDREKPGGKRNKLYLGELDGTLRGRTRALAALIEAAGIPVGIEKNMDGWLKYHFAFMAPTAGVIYRHGGDPVAVAREPQSLRDYTQACREAGDVLRAVGYSKRQPFVFNLFYWLPRWLVPRIFAKLFNSPMAAVGIGLHAKVVGPELLDLAADFDALKARAGLPTPSLDALLACVPRPGETLDLQPGEPKGAAA